MTEFYLITGFLGAGKTTFLKNLICLFKGKTLRLIINEYGQEGVDGALLKETEAILQEICGGSIFCTCRLDRFEQALAEGLAASPDVLIVEASGLSDPSNIRRILEKNEQEGKLKYIGCICIADATRLHKVFETARVCQKQLAVADLVLINKTDIASPQLVENANKLLSERFPRAKVKTTMHGELSADWLLLLEPYGKTNDEASSRPDITSQRASVHFKSNITRYELERFVAMFCEDTSRVKGFVLTADDGWVLIDCVGAFLRFQNWNGDLPAKSELTCLACTGQAMRKSLKAAASWYENKVKVIFE